MRRPAQEYDGLYSGHVSQFLTAVLHAAKGYTWCFLLTSRTGTLRARRVIAKPCVQLEVLASRRCRKPERVAAQ